MERDCTMLEVSSVGVEGKQEEEDQIDEIELSLELSIGTSCRKSDKSKPVVQKLTGSHARVRDVEPDSASYFVDPQRKREIQALRRHEARKKREEKVKKVFCRGMNGGFLVANGFADDKVRLEPRQIQTRVRDRENEDFLVEPASKKEKNGIVGEECVVDKEINDLNLTLNHNGAVNQNHCSNPTAFSSSLLTPVVPVQCPYPPLQYVPFTNGFGYPYVMPCWAPAGTIVGNAEKEKSTVSQPVACRSFRPYQGNQNLVHNLSTGCESEHNSSKDDGENTEVVSNGSQGRSSSVSDYQSTSRKGGSSRDTRSHSNHFQSEQLNASATSNPPEKSEHSGSSKESESDQAIDRTTNYTMKVVSSSITQCCPIKPSEQRGSDAQSDTVNKPILTTQNSTSAPLKETKGVMGKPPKPQTQNHDTPALTQMPCVSTTGNGPNGKTITGFLHRYTKTEVSIVCVCHGSSFSPAEFVEHAGGIDIAHPLRHITVVSSAFG